MFQSTRPRRARPAAGYYLDTVTGVSIHAPAKGATYTLIIFLITNSGFNPRAREGRDLYCRIYQMQNYQFQSTRPRRARLLGHGCPEDQSDVSIHAPAKGATVLRIPRYRRITRFNPRAREGRDYIQRTSKNTSICFNPRAREGRD